MDLVNKVDKVTWMQVGIGKTWEILLIAGLEN